MHGRSGVALLWLWALGCAPTAASPTEPAEPPLVDAAGMPTDEGEPTPEVEAPVQGAEASPEAVAPERVDLEINQRYAEQTDPKQWASRFEREGREVHDRRDAILAELGLRPGMVVADVGAGTGLFTLALAEAVGPEGTVHAVDVQPYFLDHVGHKARKAGLQNVELVRAEQSSVGLPAGSVDLILMVDAYHHVEQPAAYLASIHAALRPEGRLVVIDFEAIEGKSDAWMLEHVRASPEEFLREFEGAGFRLLSAHEGVLDENFFYELQRR